MDIRLANSPEELSVYDEWISAHPNGSLWQSLAWKTYQEALGRKVRLYTAYEKERLVGSALVTIDRTSFGLSVWDIPRGPITAAGSTQLAVRLLEKIIEDAKADRCVSIFLSPLTDPTAYCILRTASSPRHEQPDATRIIDLTKTEEEMLAQMKPKGRYNISVAQRSNLTVRSSTDIDAFYRLLKGTGERDQFGIGPKTRYKAFLERLPGSFLLLCYLKETPVAGLLGVVHGTTGIYYYGASAYEHRALMAPYLLQWEAMRHCKSQGCVHYDLLGVAPMGASTDHAWAGISSFKEKFGGELISYPHEQQLVLRPWIAKALQLKRKLLG